MKKALTLVVLIVTPAIVFAQGSVYFRNQTGLVQQWTSSSDSTLAPVPVGGGYVQLIAAPVGTALQPLGVYEGSSGFLPWYSSLAGFLAANPGWNVPYHGNFMGPLAPAPISGAPGRFDGGLASIGNISGLGADADYVIIGWTGPYATYDAAYSANLATPNSSFLGMSGIATTHTGVVVVNPGPPVPLGNTFQGMTLAPNVVPEPTTILLAGLGAVLLLLFHRRA
ncbi:MAG: PEP-CTERM sorting domain-containing protein [Verrucomicrobia bacterium]|nr:PEP-CTERM sorting domain-containing protein [Verrucomicrobiota bacterium]